MNSVPTIGELVRVPETHREIGGKWWWAEVRTVAPPYVKVVLRRGRSSVLHTYRIDEIRRIPEPAR